jgi:hypothetical protein
MVRPHLAVWFCQSDGRFLLCDNLAEAVLAERRLLCGWVSLLSYAIGEMRFLPWRVSKNPARKPAAHASRQPRATTAFPRCLNLKRW